MRAVSFPEVTVTVVVRPEPGQWNTEGAEMATIDEGGPVRRLRVVRQTGESVEAQPSRPASEPVPTLAEIWHRHIEPSMRLRRSARTIEADREALRRWSCEIPGPTEQNPRTTSPGVLCPGVLPVDQIDDAVVDAFCRHWLAQGKSAGTVNKWLKTIKKCLRAAHRAGLIPSVPRVEPLPVPRTRPPFATLDDVDRLYRAADAADWPSIGPRAPADFWRTILVGCWTYGFRTQDLVAYRTRADEGLLWSSVRFDPVCPDPRVTLTHEQGWLDYVPKKTSRTRGERVLLPISTVFRRHLELWNGLDDRRVLPNGRSKKSFAAAWQAICKAAGLAGQVGLSPINDASSQVRSIRKGCANNWQQVAPGKLAQWVIGDAPVGTTDTYYINTLPQIVEWIDRIPIPEAFSAGP